MLNPFPAAYVWNDALKTILVHTQELPETQK